MAANQRAKMCDGHHWSLISGTGASEKEKRVPKTHLSALSYLSLINKPDCRHGVHSSRRHQDHCSRETNLQHQPPPLLRDQAVGNRPHLHSKNTQSSSSTTSIKSTLWYSRRRRRRHKTRKGRRENENDAQDCVPTYKCIDMGHLRWVRQR